MTSTAQNTFLDEHIEGNLRGHLREVPVVEMTFADIDRLASVDSPITFDAYRMRDEGDLVPVVGTVVLHHDTPSVRTTFAVNPVTGRVDRGRPVGVMIRVSLRDAFGTTSETVLFTSPEAEDASEEGGNRRARDGRTRLFLPDPQRSEHGQVLALAPLHGSEASVSFVVAGIAPKDLENWIREVVGREFGDRVGSLVSVHTAAVQPNRVDVYDYDTGDLLAVNVLAAESTYLMTGGRQIETRSTAHSGVIVGR